MTRNILVAFQIKCIVLLISTTQYTSKTPIINGRESSLSSFTMEFKRKDSTLETSKGIGKLLQYLQKFDKNHQEKGHLRNHKGNI